MNHDQQRPPSKVGAAARTRLRLVAALLLGLVGAGLGLELGGHTTREVGPFRIELSAQLRPTGESVLVIPPLGSVRLDSHDGPLLLRAELKEVLPGEAQRIVQRPRSLDRLSTAIQGEVGGAARSLVLKSIGWSLLGAVLLPLVLLRTRRSGAAGGLAATILLAGTGSVAWTSRTPEALAQPRYEGLLTYAPAVVGSFEDLTTRFDTYNRELAGLLENVTRLYGAASTLPIGTEGETVDVLHISDIHSNPAAWAQVGRVVEEFGIEVIADTGDLTDRGAAAEAQLFAPIAELGAPYLFVKGNHDSEETLAQLQTIPNVTVLEGSIEVAGISFLGRPDPTYTPDREKRDREREEELQEELGSQLLDELTDETDVVMIHNPQAAEQLAGTGPLVLAGHTHKRARYLLDGTRIMVEGSTGAAGLRALDGDRPLPVQMTILHLDAETSELLYWDDITLGGLGESTVTIERHLAGAGGEFTTTEELPGESSYEAPEEVPVESSPAEEPGGEPVEVPQGPEEGPGTESAVPTG